MGDFSIFIFWPKVSERYWSSIIVDGVHDDEFGMIYEGMNGHDVEFGEERVSVN